MNKNNDTYNQRYRSNYDESCYKTLANLDIPYPHEWDYYFFKDNGYWYNE